MNNCEFLSSSHIRWWVLKSPSQMRWVSHLGFWSQPLCCKYCMTFHTPSEFLASLYMFISITGPEGVCIWIAVTSEEVRLICDHLLVSILLFMIIMDLVLLGMA